MTHGEDNQARCQTCRFWLVGSEPDLAECRRFPPDDDGWPVCSAADWCGEHDGHLTRRHAMLQVVTVLSLLLALAFALAAPLVCGWL